MSVCDDIADIAAVLHNEVMRRPRPDRYDYSFSIVGVLLTYGFLVLAKKMGWSVPLSLVLLIVVSIPVGLGLGWLKSRLQVRRRNVR